MTEKLKNKWKKLYFLAQEIANYEPWDDFEEKDRFAYVWKDKSKTVLFSFIGESICTCGIACYIGEENYIRARDRLTQEDEKSEPVFELQNGLICLWDDREGLSPADYKLVKELGFKFRGSGAWLHFDRYEIGYEPVPLVEAEVDLLITAYENLHMMLRAIYEQGVDPEFEKGNTLLRWYEPKDELYYTHPVQIEFPKYADLLPNATIKDNELMDQFRKINASDFSIELDWSYLEFLTKGEDGKAFFPLQIMVADCKTGCIIANELLNPQENRYELVFRIFDYFNREKRKPKEVFICDMEIKGLLADFCKKVGIKLTVRKKLPQISQARLELIKRILNS